MNDNTFDGLIPPVLGNNTKLKRLVLSYNMLHGNIPQEIGNLSMLIIVDTKYNVLTGSIPSELFNISSLKRIDLTGNSLTGGLAPDICSNHRLVELQGIFLSANQLHGLIPSTFHLCKELQDLSLSYNEFSGKIPDEIGYITKLKTLYLGINNFIGGIPEYLGNLTYLEMLSLRGGSLTGRIPQALFNMSSLKQLDLSNNSLSGSLPSVSSQCNLPHITGEISENTFRCKRLEVIQLADNMLTGSISKDIRNFTFLQILNLAENNFTGRLPAEVGSINLKKLNVHGNHLSGVIPSEVFNISTLQILDLNRNRLTGTLPSGLGLQFPNLQELYLGENELTGSIPSSISNASQLATIYMSLNSFTGSIPNLGNLRLLKRLFLAENNLTEGTSKGELKFLSYLTNCRHLETVDVSLNQLNGVLPSSLGNLSASLQIFSAFGSKIKGTIPVGVGNLTSLTGMYLDSNELTGVIPNTIGKLRNLERIYLEYNRLEGHLPTDICQLSKLGDIYISHNMIRGAIPACFGELKSLQRVFLDSNNLTSTIPLNFWNLNGLVGLNLSTNSFKGYLPSEISNLKVATNVDLSWNQFSGDIPSKIGSAQSIVYLSLAQNRLQGPIPESLSNLISLETLDLSSNNLSGMIPKSLEALRYLRYFNVSVNELEGEIPSGGCFSNFSAESFRQNHELCGVARLHVLPCRTKHSKSKTVSSLIKYVVPPLLSTILMVTVVLILIRKRNQHVKMKMEESQLAAILSPIAYLRNVSYLELVRATHSFSESNLLGKGSYGSVYRGELNDGTDVAVKVFNTLTEESTKSFYAECKILSNIRHRNLTKILSCCSTTDFKALVLDYMPNGNLEKWLYSQDCCLSMLQRLNIAIDIASALEYLHCGLTTPIVHCDLKPNNILLDEDMTAHLCDFGIAKIFEQDMDMAQTKTLATIGYMAPEYGTHGIVSTSGDIYSYGIILLEMFTGKKPTDDMFGETMNLKCFVGESLRRKSLMEVVDSDLIRDVQQFSEVIQQFVSSIFCLGLECLKDCPEDRMSISNVVDSLRKAKIEYLAIR
ncbi:LRR receptor-like serine/threonine-protein kinase FLS2 isoform X1 [Solanum pennellii]|uniref:LRR receptor-like serine/threonine-protein kinase FLS2 isoform X1 n=2 Tax=Solanum pennellii TaxID=28526 RepID=A0ABM1FPA7_SOLPN|nr:LRR receptor-like serine/threonine-protein kinase FLS2 isoform X1 [Solanum pennellii]